MLKCEVFKLFRIAIVLNCLASLTARNN